MTDHWLKLSLRSAARSQVVEEPGYEYSQPKQWSAARYLTARGRSDPGVSCPGTSCLRYELIGFELSGHELSEHVLTLALWAMSCPVTAKSKRNPLLMPLMPFPLLSFLRNSLLLFMIQQKLCREVESHTIVASPQRT